MKRDNNTNKAVQWIARIFTIAVIVASVVLLVIFGKYITVDNIVNATSSNKLFAAVTLVLLYGLKGLTVFIPINLLMVVGGFIFPLPVAILVNMIGVWFSMTLPFYVTRFLGGKWISALIERYPKLEKFYNMQKDNVVFFSYLMRIAGFFPFDIVSMYMGSLNMPYGKYILGSLIGILPGTVATTIMGTSITDPLSPAFIISCSCMLVITAVSFFWYRGYMKKEEQKHEQNKDE